MEKCTNYKASLLLKLFDEPLIVDEWCEDEFSPWRNKQRAESELYQENDLECHVCKDATLLIRLRRTSPA